LITIFKGRQKARSKYAHSSFYLLQFVAFEMLGAKQIISKTPKEKL
jgi:hypothetical protein